MAKTKTTFSKGHKTPKRKGPSRKTLLLETFAQTIVEGGMDKFKQELMKLNGTQFVYAYTTLFEFVKPKLARTDMRADVNINKEQIEIELSDGSKIKI